MTEDWNTVKREEGKGLQATRNIRVNVTTETFRPKGRVDFSSFPFLFSRRSARIRMMLRD